jgi:hypothetical protein
MIQKRRETQDGNQREQLVVSDYVRLCFSEGLKPAEAFRELKHRLLTVKEVKEFKK